MMRNSVIEGGQNKLKTRQWSSTAVQFISRHLWPLSVGKTCSVRYGGRHGLVIAAKSLLSVHSIRLVASTGRKISQFGTIAYSQILPVNSVATAQRDLWLSFGSIAVLYSSLSFALTRVSP